MVSNIGEEAVLIAMRGLEHRGHVIVTDNFFSSLQLCMSLMQWGFWTTGTVRKSRRGFPLSLAGFPKTSLLPRDTIAVKMHRSRKVVAICWVDRKPVFLISTATNPLAAERCVASRWVDRDRVEFLTSPILLQYEQNMRGIDVVDHKVSLYTTQLQSHKWWHCILLDVLDLTLNNSWTLQEADCIRLGLLTYARQLFHKRLAVALMVPSMHVVRVPQRGRNLQPAGVGGGSSP
jgi:hypothetical protein